MRAPLEIQDLSRHFGGVRALDDVSFTAGVEPFTAVIGPNGAGKTTLFNVISGIFPATHGLVLFEGRPLSGLRPDQVARLGVARTFQNLGVFPDLTVAENLLLGRQAVAAGAAGYFRALFRREERDGTVEEVLDILGLARFRGDRAGDLPFGIQRLVDLGRAAASRPKLLLLDEPASGLSGPEKAVFTASLRSLMARFGSRTVIIEHDMGLIMGVADRIFVLDHGRLISSGSPRDVLNDPAVVEAYIGRPAAGEA